MTQAPLIPPETERPGAASPLAAPASPRRRYATCRRCQREFTAAGWGAQSTIRPDLCCDCNAHRIAFGETPFPARDTTPPEGAHADRRDHDEAESPAPLVENAPSGVVVLRPEGA